MIESGTSQGEKKLLMVSITSLKSLKLLRWVNMAKDKVWILQGHSWT